MPHAQTKQTVYTLRYRRGDRGTVLITRQALQAAGCPADRAVVPAFTTLSRAQQFLDTARPWLAGPVDLDRWPLRTLALRATFAGHKVRIDPHLEVV